MIRMQLIDVQVEPRTAVDFYKRRLEEKKVVVIYSGIDEVSIAVYAQILADIYDVTGMVNTGIAGSLKAEINIGNIVLSNDALQYNMGATGFGYEPGQIPRVETLTFEADEGPIGLAKECCSRVNLDIRTFAEHVVTGNQFVSDKEKKKWLVDIFGGYCTGMEGAAITQACYLNSTPFLTTRVISDKADGSASVDYPASEAKAAVHSVNLPIEIVRSLR